MRFAPRLTCVSRLADLSLVGGNARGVDKASPEPVLAGLEGGHALGRKADDVERPHGVHLQHVLEPGEGEGTLLPDGLARGRHAGAGHYGVGRGKRRRREVERGRNRRLGGHVGGGEGNLVGAEGRDELLGQSLLGGEVGDDGAAAVQDDVADCGGAEAASAAGHEGYRRGEHSECDVLVSTPSTTGRRRLGLGFCDEREEMSAGRGNIWILCSKEIGVSFNTRAAKRR